MPWPLNRSSAAARIFSCMACLAGQRLMIAPIGVFCS
jgi:hypothetical protein